MAESIYRECQDCKYSFKLPIAIRRQKVLFCQRCNSKNIAIVNKNVYITYTKMLYKDV